MRLTIVFYLLISSISMLSCNNNVNNNNEHVFRKHTDVEEAGLKGKVKSIATYQCLLGDTIEHCYDISQKKYNTNGFLVEEIDTTGDGILSYKYSYNNDGLLAKVIFSSNDSFMGTNETYYRYSFGEHKKTTIVRESDSTSKAIDSSVTLYDKEGNEIEYTDGDMKIINKYDEHGFLTSSKLTKPTKTVETHYTNNDKGKTLKKTWSSDNGAQTYQYDKDGNTIQVTNFDSTGKTESDYLTGYCEFDKNGNFLKSITVCPQTKHMSITRRIIEYY